MSAPASTQERHPWRSAARTGLQVLVGVISLTPYIVNGVDLPLSGAGAQVVGVAVLLSRVMALPEVNRILRRYRLLALLAPGDEGEKPPTDSR